MKTHDYKQKVSEAVPDVSALIDKHGLDIVASVVNKRKKERAIKRQLAANKRELEQELERIQKQLAKI